jgi:small-conductance mechanosensitive channel
VIKFPNSNVLGSAVCNYSWPLFPYIWNEIKFNVAYESDLEFVSETVRRIATEEIGEAMLERVRTSRSLFSKTPVDQLEVREYPAVLFRVSNNTWLEAIVRYLVEPKRAGRVQNS